MKNLSYFGNAKREKKQQKNRGGSELGGGGGEVRLDVNEELKLLGKFSGGLGRGGPVGGRGPIGRGSVWM